jgi:hypothetical protein
MAKQSAVRDSEPTDEIESIAARMDQREIDTVQYLDDSARATPATSHAPA